MPRFNSIFFIKIGLKLSYFCQKITNFPPQTPFAPGGSIPRPHNSLHTSAIAYAHLYTLTCNEKMGLKLELKNCGKTKLFCFGIYGILFSNCVENLNVIFFKVTKIAISTPQIKSLNLYNGGKGTLLSPRNPVFFQCRKLMS